MNEDDARKAPGADNERETIPDIPSLHSPYVPRVTLQGEISEELIHRGLFSNVEEALS